MPTNTYVALRTTTVTVATPSVTLDLTGITGYTDLVLVASIKVVGSASNTWVRLGNSSIDTGANYSWTRIMGNGSTATSARGSNTTDGVLLGDSYTTDFTADIIQIQNYSNTTTNKTVLTRNSFAPNLAHAAVGLWRSTSAINYVQVYASGVNLAVGSTFTIYGIAAASVGAKATGGTIYQDSTHFYHVFAGNGTFTPTQSITADYLVVAGGGGGAGLGGAGGGAGGLRSTVDATGGGGTLESALALTSGTAYTVTVGAGGAGGDTSTGYGASGSNSVFSTITSTGGGGARYAVAGLTGGSGAGAGSSGSSFGNGTTNQGYRGGSTVDGIPGASRGGGGGAGAVGVTGISSLAGAGGIGVAISTLASATGTGVNNYFAGGGGGGFDANNGGVAGAGGVGGGGAAAAARTTNTGSAGIANTGGGGGGSSGQTGVSSGGAGGAGGSGIVIVRYAK